MSFEIATWYDTWNSTGLDNLVQQKVPLGYATRYNLAFGEFVEVADGGYTVDLDAAYASQVQQQIRAQAPGALIYAGVSDTGLSATVADNNANGNRSTANIVAYLQQNGLNGINIDSEGGGMGGVATENGNAQTSLADTEAWTEYALKNGLRGMFSWRLDNDHGQHGTDEDVDPTFTGAKAIYDTVQAGAGAASGSGS